MSRNVRYALLVLVLFLAWLLSGVFVDTPANQTEGRDKPLTHVDVITSSARLYQPSLSFNAHTEPFRLVNLRAETSGPLVATDVPEGAEVKRGRVVGKIATEARLLRVVEARSLLNQVRLEYEGALELQGKGLLADAEIARNKFSVDSAKAALDAAQRELSRVEITAPFDGILNERLYEIGDYIQPGQIFAEFLQLDPLKAVFQVSETEVIALDPEQPVEFVLADGRKLTGSFLFRSAKANRQSRAFKVEAVFENPDNLILADLTGRISIALRPVEAHSVPAAVLSLDTEGQLIVKTLNSDQIVGSYRVKIVEDSTDSIWVTGLPEVIDVIVAGYEYVGIGEKVKASRRSQARRANGEKTLNLNALATVGS